MQLSKVDSGDWEALRLAPRRYYPPKLKTEKVLIEADLTFTGQIAPPPPPIWIDAPQGIIFGRASNRSGKRSLMVQFGMENPFLDQTLLFMRRHRGQWNHTFNLWQIPILSQTQRAALSEAFVLAQDALLELQWGWHIEILDRWPGLTDTQARVFDKFIALMNGFWSHGVGDLIVPIDAVPVAVFFRTELEQRVAAYLQAQAKGEKKDRSPSPRHCVNYLRHQHTAYEARLAMKPYGAAKDYALQVFKDCNRAIADAYPYLAAEVNEQNAQRSL